MVCPPLATRLRRSDHGRRRPHPILGSLPAPRLVPALLSLHHHGPCHLRAPLLPRALLFDIDRRLLCGLDYALARPAAAVGCVRDPVRRGYRPVRRVQRHLLRHGRRELAVGVSQVVRLVEDYGLDPAVCWVIYCVRRGARVRSRGFACMYS